MRTVSVIAFLLATFIFPDDSFCTDDNDDVQVDTPFGLIKGKKMTALNNKSYVAFTNIPYASSPVGGLRFAKPEPHPVLEGTFDARKPIKKCICAQAFLNGEEQGTEDCLILNVYLSDPNLKSENKKVAVYFHGGGFSVGSSIIYNPGSFVTNHDVIVVTVNYRLGVFGFLSFENTASPGNYGLWDQALALQWVRDNIAAFGGDPYDVTAAGVSAGGVAVTLMSLSPVTKSLFTKAYAHSGIATGYCSHCNTPQQDALNVAKSVGCWDGEVNKHISVEEGQAIIQCLRSRPASKVQTTAGFGINKLSFVPVVDGDFIPDLPGKLLLNETYLKSIGFFEKPHLLGLNSNEGSFSQFLVDMAKFMIDSNSEMTSKVKDEAWNTILDDSYTKLIKCRLVTNDMSANVKTKVTDWYQNKFGEKAFSAFFNDVFFSFPTFDILESFARNKIPNAWFLYLSHDPNFIQGPHKGMLHGLDIAYWFDISMETMESLLHARFVNDFNDDNEEVKILFSSVMADFIKSGNPGYALKDQLNMGWPAYDLENEWYLSLNLNPSIEKHLEKEKRDRWEAWRVQLREEKTHRTDL